MEDISEVSAKEVLTVILNTDISLVFKIPRKLLEIIEKRAEKYSDEIKLKENVPLEEQPISDDAKAILTLIYRDFWCDDNEKLRLNQKLQKSEQEMYDPFKNSKRNIVMANKVEENKSLLVVKKKWYEKAWDKIRNMISFFY